MASIDYDTHIRQAHRLHAAAVDQLARRFVAGVAAVWQRLRSGHRVSPAALRWHSVRG